MIGDKIIAECQQAIASWSRLGLSGLPTISYVVRGSWPKSGKKRYAGKFGGPWGTCLADGEHGVLCSFIAQEIIDWVRSVQSIMEMEIKK